MEELEIKCFEIITNVGSAKSFYIEAIDFAKQGDFVKARECIKEGDEIFKDGHRAHSDLVQKEASGEKLEISLILVHAEDQLMNADGFKTIANEFIDLFERISK